MDVDQANVDQLERAANRRSIRSQTTATAPQSSTPQSSTPQSPTTQRPDPEIDLRTTSEPPQDTVSPERLTQLLLDDDVEVRSRFDGRWTHGFTIAAVDEHAYQLRRRSDGSVLPAWFPDHMVRATTPH